MGIGLVGMSTYAKPPKLNKKPRVEATTALDMEERSASIKRKPTDTTSSNGGRQSQEMEALIDAAGDRKLMLEKERVVLFCGRVVVTKRQLGIAGAMVNGLWGGMNLIPLHFAQKEGFGGAAFLVSYACGSMMVNTTLWVLYWLYLLHHCRFNFRESFEMLPDFHLDKLWGPGFLSGSLYSIGNFGSILSVTYLGQGVGFSICQVNILVSGLWGIFFFKEIKGADTIIKWVISACITVTGILWLTYEKTH